MGRLDGREAERATLLLAVSRVLSSSTYVNRDILGGADLRVERVCNKCVVTADKVHNNRERPRNALIIATTFATDTVLSKILYAVRRKGMCAQRIV